MDQNENIILKPKLEPSTNKEEYLDGLVNNLNILDLKLEPDNGVPGISRYRLREKTKINYKY